MRSRTGILELEEEFDPLGEAEALEQDEEEVEIWERIGKDSVELREVEVSVEPPVTTRERIEDLIEHVPGRKKVFVSFIEFCRQPQTVSACDAKIDELQRHNHSVFTPIILRQMLEFAGAIAYIPGEPIEREAAEEDSEFLVVTLRDEGSWIATAEGLAYVAEEDPTAELSELLGKEPEYREVYLFILGYCADEARSKVDLDLLIDKNEQCQSPRRFSGYFVDRLEKVGAMEWDGDWKTTELGKSVL